MSILLKDLVKLYDGHAVVNRVSLEIADGEFFVLLGPSGSGKSTILRMIAGLSGVDEGSILLHGRDVTSIAPQLRGVGLVFQHYALFRHMTVAENVEFALRVRRVRASERRLRRDELLEQVGLAGFAARMPGQLSGGQQQRVALARALAHKPSVLLMDEPFGALDARIRIELRRTIRRIQRDLGVTTIFVTHDQEEAFELADRIGVMNLGRLLEAGSPNDLYLRPRTEFAATFLGTANLMVGVASAGEVRLGPIVFPASEGELAAGESRRVQVLFRPEDVLLRESEQEINAPVLGEAVVEERVFSGTLERLTLRLAPIPGVRSIAPPPPFGGEHIRVEAFRSQDLAVRHPLLAGGTTWVGVRRIHTLTHPGLSLLLAIDGSVESKAAANLGVQVARAAHARMTLLATAARDPQAELQRIKDAIGGGLASLESTVSPSPAPEALAAEMGGRPIDLVIVGLPAREPADHAQRLLQSTDAHLLLVPATPPRVGLPSRVLICAAAGEPGKETIRFAARLLRHLGAEATILTVLPPDHDDLAGNHAKRFLKAGVRTMTSLGVNSRSLLRLGSVFEEVTAEVAATNPDLLVVGAPVGARRERMHVGTIASNLLERGASRPLLIVRSGQAAFSR